MNTVKAATLGKHTPLITKNLSRPCLPVTPPFNEFKGAESCRAMSPLGESRSYRTFARSAEGNMVR